MPDSTNSISPSRNHVFTASSFTVVRFEDVKDIANLKADLVAFYQPANSQELFAIERIAIAQQQIFRGARLEAGLFTSAFNEACDPAEGEPFQPMSELLAGGGDIEITREQNRHYGVAEGFRRVARESNAWSLLLRYQTQAERQYRRALEEFDRLKRLRPELPGESTTPESDSDFQPPRGETEPVEAVPSRNSATPVTRTKEDAVNPLPSPRSSSQSRCSERKLHPELDNSLPGKRPGHLPKGAAGNRCVRIRELRVTQRVDALRLKLQKQSLTDARVLDHGKIEIEYSRSTNAREQT